MIQLVDDEIILKYHSLMKKTRIYSRYTKDAARLLGESIKLGRKSRKFTERDFADRLGISRATLQKVEKGDLKCELGIVLEAAALSGVALFDVDFNSSFSGKLESVSDKLALLPKKVIKRPVKEVDDNF